MLGEDLARFKEMTASQKKFQNPERHGLLKKRLWNRESLFVDLFVEDSN